jgi:hypothetical protein
MRITTLLALIAVTWLGATRAPSQVAISEINFSAQGVGDDQWVELVNLGGESVELNGWSLYLATDDPGGFGNYWFAIPLGLELAPAEFLRIHWLAPIPFDPPGQGEIYTGDSTFNFMFGYFAEPLDPEGGALAVLNTQNNLLMNNSNIIQDWVSWGGNGYPREDLAIQAGKWTAGVSISPPQEEDSIALNLAMDRDPVALQAYFHDASPTPNAANAVGGETRTFAGSSCVSGGGNSPILATQSFPVIGNRDFSFRLDNTLGELNEIAVLVLSPNAIEPDDPSAPLPLLYSNCPIWIDLATAYGSVAVLTEVGSTTFPFDLAPLGPEFMGLEFYAVAAILNLDRPDDLGLTDLMKVTLSN